VVVVVVVVVVAVRGVGLHQDDAAAMPAHKLNVKCVGQGVAATVPTCTGASSVVRLLVVAGAIPTQALLVDYVGLDMGAAAVQILFQEKLSGECPSTR